MSDIALKEAIRSGAWFECHATHCNRDVHYRLRVLAFTRSSVEEIDPSFVGRVPVEGILWLLSVEAVTLSKTRTGASRIKETIRLIDEDGFEFKAFSSDLDKAIGKGNSGPHRLSAHPLLSRAYPQLCPKVTARGAVVFVLPDEQNNYYLAFKDVLSSFQKPEYQGCVIQPMSNIPLKEAIASGAWLECHARFKVDAGNEKEIHYRLRVLAFARTSVDDIDASLVGKVLVEGVLWLLSVEVVIVSKMPIDGHWFQHSIKLIDEDGCEFENYCGDLDKNESAGLRRFSNNTGVPPLSPKIKATGSIAFILPDETDNYYLAFKDGNTRAD